MFSSKIRTVIGTISGTSMDGIDIALLRTDGQTLVEAGFGATLPYPEPLRNRLLDFLQDPSRAMSDPWTGLEQDVTDAFSAAIDQFLQHHNINRTEIELIGLHGQTVYHRPELGFTRQLGDGRRMAARLGISVVDQFRLADVKAGGQGAPLVPVYHHALASRLQQPVMILNWGGVGNVTYLDGTTILAFDTGPASALCDDWVRRHFGLPFDEGGRLSQLGQVNRTVLARLLDNPFFATRPPKSLDRNDFHQRAKIVDSLSPHDGLATLAAFTIEATCRALDHVPTPPLQWFVAGGGRNNLHFMQGLAQRLAVHVAPVESIGWDGDFLEAQCFGYLAVRSKLGLPLSLPGTTGVKVPMTGGRIWPA